MTFQSCGGHISSILIHLKWNEVSLCRIQNRKSHPAAPEHFGEIRHEAQALVRSYRQISERLKSAGDEGITLEMSQAY